VQRRDLVAPPYKTGYTGEKKTLDFGGEDKAD